MPNAALERARAIQKQAREQYEAANAGTAAPSGEEGVDEAARAAAEEAARSGAQPEHDSTLEHEDEPQDKPTAAPAGEPTLQALQSQLDKLQRNYDELRSYADRVSGENGSLRRENETLNSQIQILLAGKQSGGRDEPPTVDPTTQPLGNGKATVPTQEANETDEEYLARLLDKVDGLRTADEDYHHIVRPLLGVIRDLERRLTERDNAINSRLDPVIENANTEIRQSAEERRKAAVQAYFSAIEDKHSDFRQVLVSEEFAKFISNHPAGELYHKAIWPEQWPEGEARRGSAGEIIGILSEFKAALSGQGAPSVDDKQRREREDARRRAAEADAEPAIRPTQPNPQAEGELVKRSDINAWSKDPVLFKQKRQLIHEAINSGRVIEDVVR